LPGSSPGERSARCQSSVDPTLPPRPYSRSTGRTNMNFTGILIGSEDPQRLVDYYIKLLGEPAFNQDGFTAWEVGSGSVALGKHSEVHGRNASPGRLIWNMESTDVKGDFERFKAAG